MKNTVVMTVYNRPQLTLLNTLVALGKALPEDTDILIMDDGSSAPYEPLLEQFKGLPLRFEHCDTCKDNPDCYNLDGYNNPSYANNQALKHVDSENIFWMSSDIMVPPKVIHAALKLDLRNVAWMPCIVDLDTNQCYLGPERIAPFGWFFGTRTENVRKVGWDQEFLKGIAFEDNDFMARLGVELGRFVIDKSIVAWHQSHPAIAYSDNFKGWRTNEAYIKAKWNGIPWHKKLACPLKLSLTEVNAQMVLDIAGVEQRKMKATA